MNECNHKWKIIKEIHYKEKSLFARMFFVNRYGLNTIYHLQCSKCGDIKQKWTHGIKDAKSVVKGERE